MFIGLSVFLAVLALAASLRAISEASSGERTTASAAVIAVACAAGLVVWFLFARPELSDLLS